MTNPGTGRDSIRPQKLFSKERLSWSFMLPIGLAMILLYLAIRGADWQLMVESFGQADILPLRDAGRHRGHCEKRQGDIKHLPHLRRSQNAKRGRQRCQQLGQQGRI